MTCLHAANCTCLAVIDFFLLDFDFDYSDFEYFQFHCSSFVIVFGGRGGAHKIKEMKRNQFFFPLDFDFDFTKYKNEK